MIQQVRQGRQEQQEQDRRGRRRRLHRQEHRRLIRFPLVPAHYLRLQQQDQYSLHRKQIMQKILLRLKYLLSYSPAKEMQLIVTIAIAAVVAII